MGLRKPQPFNDFTRVVYLYTYSHKIYNNMRVLPVYICILYIHLGIHFDTVTR